MSSFSKQQRRKLERRLLPYLWILVANDRLLWQAVVMDVCEGEPATNNTHQYAVMGDAEHCFRPDRVPSHGILTTGAGPDLHLPALIPVAADIIRQLSPLYSYILTSTRIMFSCTQISYDIFL